MKKFARKINNKQIVFPSHGFFPRLFLEFVARNDTTEIIFYVTGKGRIFKVTFHGADKEFLVRLEDYLNLNA